MEEKTLSSSYLYKGKILTLRKDLVKTGNGVEATREIIEHHKAVVVVPVLNKDRVVLIKQYRKAVEAVLFEVPAGLLHEDEEPLIAAKRELAEETGFVSKEIIPLVDVYASPGFTDEYMHFFLAFNLVKGETNFDHDEYIETYIVTIDEYEKMIMDGRIKDAKTVLGYFLLKNYLLHLDID